MFNYSVILSNVGLCCDRFMPKGYGESYTNQQLFERLSNIKEITGVELIGGSNINKNNVPEIKEFLNKYNLKVTSIIPDHFGKPLWKLGAFTAPDKKIRHRAIDETCKMIDIAEEVGCDLINIWNGQDGFDYPLQVNYCKAHEWLLNGIQECADYNPEVKIALEYKPKEPRKYSFISNVFSTLFYINKINRDNVGITIDIGHSLEAYENIAEAVCTALNENKLFHMHLNNNYRLWDDDMIVGSIHTPEYIELFYWLKKLGYEGWLSMDQYPYREDGVQAVQQSVEWLKKFESIVERVDEGQVNEILNNQDSIAAVKLIRNLLIGN